MIFAQEEKGEKMSVIVKGMDMPKRCYECPLRDAEYGVCNMLIMSVREDIPEECPLVEVVRCKDCKHCSCDSIFNEYWCNGRKVVSDGFCNYGEKKDENN